MRLYLFVARKNNYETKYQPHIYLLIVTLPSLPSTLENQFHTTTTATGACTILYGLDYIIDKKVYSIGQRVTVLSAVNGSVGCEIKGFLYLTFF